MESTLTLDQFKDQWFRLDLRVGALRDNASRFCDHAKKLAEVEADLVIAKAKLDEFVALYPELHRQMKAQVWAKMRPGRKIEDYPGDRA